MFVIVKVSSLPLLFSVKDIPVPATNLPFKYPAVVSLDETKTLTSVSALITTQADPFHILKFPAEELKYTQPTIKLAPSLSTDGSELFAPKYLSSKLS